MTRNKLLLAKEYLASIGITNANEKYVRQADIPRPFSFSVQAGHFRYFALSYLRESKNNRRVRYNYRVLNKKTYESSEPMTYVELKHFVARIILKEKKKK